MEMEDMVEIKVEIIMANNMDITINILYQEELGNNLLEATKCMVKLLNVSSKMVMDNGIMLKSK